MQNRTSKPIEIPKNSPSVIFTILGIFLISLLLGGCLKIDPIKKHKLLTTFFDGVPDLPSVEELCEDNVEDLFNKYYEKQISNAATGDWKEDKAVKKDSGSRHKPWSDKNCRGCHDFKAQNKLRLPLNEICYLCHKNFIQGTFVHGPVAVGSCTACHNPHSSENPSLLKNNLKEICFKCHHEKRLTEQMHAKIIASGMLCVDCHDPHSRNIRYFLK